MSKTSNPTLIGTFVIGAVALIAVAVVLFGGAEIFQDKRQFVTYFDRSVKGLRIGSNVLFKGVRIGYVTDIRLVGDVDSLKFLIPVIFEVLPDAVSIVQGNQDLGSLANREQIDLQRLIDAGLRAQLNSESFVTGQLLIDLDLLPGSPAVLHGHDSRYLEIPSVPSDIQQAIEDVRGFISDIQTSVDIRQIMKNVDSILAGIDRFVNSEKVADSLAGIDRIISADSTQDLTRVLHAAATDLRTLLTDTRQLVNHTDTEVQGLAERLNPALQNLDNAIDEATIVMSNIGNQLGAESEVNYELVNTLNEIQSAARSLRMLLEYLEQHPEAVLKGKKE